MKKRRVYRSIALIKGIYFSIDHWHLVGISLGSLAEEENKVVGWQNTDIVPLW